jgi:hypothetical protein
MSDIALMRQERKRLFENAVRRDRKPAHVPLISHAWTWKVVDAGYKFSDGLLNYDNLYKICCEHHEKYNFDSYMEIGTAFLMRVSEAFGKCDYIIDDEHGGLNYRETAYMQIEDYDTLLKKGYEKFFWENLVPAKFGWDTYDHAKEKIRKGMREQRLYAEHAARMVNQFNEVFGVPLIAKGRYMCPAEMLLWGLQGMKGLSMAMRRSPDKLEAVLKELLAFSSGGFREAVKNQQSSDRAVFDYRMTMIAHTIMNPKQFERYYWPYLKEFIDTVVEYDKIALIFIEGTASHVLEYLQDVPKGHLAIMFENIDIFEVKKKLGDRISIAGGYPCRLLYKGSEKECIGFCDKIMNEIGYDGSYIFCADKMQGFKSDGSSENTRLVNDYFRNCKM